MDSSLPPNSSSTIVLAHASIQRLARQSATCKVTSAILAGGAMLFASGRVGGESLLWAVAPIGVLAFADAGYAARARSLAVAAGKGLKGSDLLLEEVSAGGVADISRCLTGILSWTVWPFYLALMVLVAGLGSIQPVRSIVNPSSPVHVVSPNPQPPVSAAQPNTGFPARPVMPPYGAGGQPGGPSAQGAPANRISRFPSTNPAVPSSTLPRPQGAPGTVPGPVNGMNRPPMAAPQGNGVAAPIAPAPASPSPSPPK